MEIPPFHFMQLGTYYTNILQRNAREIKLGHELHQGTRELVNPCTNHGSSSVIDGGAVVGGERDTVFFFLNPSF